MNKKWIDAKQKLHISVFDEQYDDYIIKYMTIEEILDEYTDEGCPKSESVKGRWINAYPDIEPNPMFMYGICSVCGFEQTISSKLNFCPNCGADMRREGNGMTFVTKQKGK